MEQDKLQIIILIVFLTTIFNLVLNKLSIKLGIVSKQNNRSIHKGKIPYLGGLTIGLVLLIIIKVLNFDQHFETIVIYSILILTTGIIDDIYILTPGQKLILLMFPIIWIVFFKEIYLYHLGLYEYFGYLYLGKIGQIFTLLCVALLINAYNYIDGIDGLAISLSLIFFINLYFLIEEENLKYALFLISTCYFIMLLFNLCNITGIKTFLGNAGSLMTGFIISFFCILTFLKFNIHPTKIIFSISYPIYDFIAVNLNRIIKKKNIFNPGKDHFHHFLFKKFSKKHLPVILVISFLNIFHIIFGLLMIKYFNYSVALIFFIINFFIYLFITKKLQS